MNYTGNKRTVVVRARHIQFTHASHADVVLQACCDALSAGGTIGIGVGTFNIYLQVSSSNVVNIIGSGRGRTILKRQISGSSVTITLTGSNLTVSSLTVDGNYPTNTSNSFAELEFVGDNILVTDTTNLTKSLSPSPSYDFTIKSLAY